MNKKQATELWEVSTYVVGKICKHIHIDPNNIPDDTVPIYIPDGRYTKDPHRFYIFVLDVINNTHLELEGIDEGIIKACVQQLKQVGLIVPKYGKSMESVDYHDYMISPNRELFYNWQDAKMKRKIELIRPLVSVAFEGVTLAGTMMSGMGSLVNANYNPNVEMTNS